MGTFWVQSWKCEEQETVMTGCRRWNVAGSKEVMVCGGNNLSRGTSGPGLG